MTLDPRYECIRTLARRGERWTQEARDRLTGGKVVLKTDQLTPALQELRSLLALPPGVGPAVLDAVWTGERLLFALEHLPGSTLGDAADRLSRDELPCIVRNACDCLAHLHRSDIVHADIKPSNIFLSEGESSSVRLLDFGYALSRLADPWDEREIGGTPTYMAPELAKGWVVDGRADLYSLGLTLRELFPWMDEDAAWSDLLVEMCQPVPAHRCPSAVAAREEVEKLFRLQADDARYPRLGAGPIRRRDRLLDEARPSPAHPVLIQSRAAHGLSRFLCEVLLRHVSEQGPPMRLLDVPSLGEPIAGADAAAFVETRIAAGEALLCGVADPSPGLHETPAPLAACLSSWDRRLLPALDIGAFSELVAESLGVGGEQPEALARGLHARSDGSLAVAADGFGAVLREAGAEDGLVWILDRERLDAALAGWSPPETGSEAHAVPAGAAELRRICARAGRSCRREVLEALMEQLGRGEEFGDLIDRGDLLADDAGRLAFRSERSWRDASRQPPDGAAAIDAWLHGHASPDLEQPGEIAAACRRARRLEDRAAEGKLLGRALAHALDLFHCDHLRHLIAYPQPEPERWTVERVLEQARTLREILGPPWTEGRILYAAATGIHPIAPSVSVPIQERVASSDDPQAAVDGLLVLLELAVNQRDGAEYERILKRLEEHRERTGLPRPGVLGFFRAWRAMVTGHPSEALSAAEQAAERLDGSRLPQESLNLQLLAILTFGCDPESGIEKLRAAIASARSPEHEAIFRRNLCGMLREVGDVPGSAACADEGIERLQGRVADRRLVSLRIERAWSWADADQIVAARREASGLLSLSAVRENRSHMVTVRLLRGACHLQGTLSRAAISETARAWIEVQDGCFPGLKSECLWHLLDTLLDLEAWETVRAYGDRITLESDGEDPADEAIGARALALRAQADEEIDRAAGLLEEHLAAVRGLSDRLVAARYVYHLGIVRMEQEKAASGLFREALDLLGDAGYGYHRGRIWLGLGMALAMEGASKEADAILERAVELARRIESRGLLSECLQTRLQLSLGE